MNTNSPTPSPREEQEVRVVALLLGELDAGQVAEVEALLADDAGLRAFRQRMEQTIGLVRAASVAPAEPAAGQPEPRLAEDRRNALLERLKQPASRPRRKVLRFPNMREQMKWLVPMAAAACVLLLLAVSMFSNGIRSRHSRAQLLGDKRNVGYAAEIDRLTLWRRMAQAIEPRPAKEQREQLARTEAEVFAYSVPPATPAPSSSRARNPAEYNSRTDADYDGIRSTAAIGPVPAEVSRQYFQMPATQPVPVVPPPAPGPANQAAAAPRGVPIYSVDVVGFVDGLVAKDGLWGQGAGMAPSQPAADDNVPASNLHRIDAPKSATAADPTARFAVIADSGGAPAGGGGMAARPMPSIELPSQSSSQPADVALEREIRFKSKADGMDALAAITVNPIGDIAGNAGADFTPADKKAAREQPDLFAGIPVQQGLFRNESAGRNAGAVSANRPGSGPAGEVAAFGSTVLGTGMAGGASAATAQSAPESRFGRAGGNAGVAGEWFVATAPKAEAGGRFDRSAPQAALPDLQQKPQESGTKLSIALEETLSYGGMAGVRGTAPGKSEAVQLFDTDLERAKSGSEFLKKATEPAVVTAPFAAAPAAKQPEAAGGDAKGAGVGGGGMALYGDVAPDGKVIVGGGFTAQNSVPRNRMARLNANGSLDTTFAPSRGEQLALGLPPSPPVLNPQSNEALRRGNRPALETATPEGTVRELRLLNESVVVGEELKRKAQVLLSGNKEEAELLRSQIARDGDPARAASGPSATPANVPEMLRDAKAYADLRQLELAEKKMVEVLKAEPANQAASDYLRKAAPARTESESRQPEAGYAQRVVEVAKAWNKKQEAQPTPTMSDPESRERTRQLGREAQSLPEPLAKNQQTVQLGQLAAQPDKQRGARPAAPEPAMLGVNEPFPAREMPLDVMSRARRVDGEKSSSLEGATAPSGPVAADTKELGDLVVRAGKPVTLTLADGQSASGNGRSLATATTSPGRPVTMAASTRDFGLTTGLAAADEAGLPEAKALDFQSGQQGAKSGLASKWAFQTQTQPQSPAPAGVDAYFLDTSRGGQAMGQGEPARIAVLTDGRGKESFSVALATNGLWAKADRAPQTEESPESLEAKPKSSTSPKIPFFDGLFGGGRRGEATPPPALTREELAESRAGDWEQARGRMSISGRVPTGGMPGSSPAQIADRTTIHAEKEVAQLLTSVDKPPSERASEKQLQEFAKNISPILPPSAKPAPTKRLSEVEEKGALKANKDVAKRTPPPSNLKPKPEVLAATNAFSTFSLNVSDVAFKLAQASLAAGTLPEPGTVRSEEFLNAFNYYDPAPTGGERLAFAWERARHPFAHNRELLRFSVQTAAQGREPGRPLNLVVLLDNSGSMERADRVAIVREALQVLAGQLTAADTISVVAFARTPRLWVDGMKGGQPGELLPRVLTLNPDGGTNLEAALDTAYEVALRHAQATANNRVILLTDGAANLGNLDPEALKAKVESYRRRNVALDCFGVGWEGYNDTLLETLSRNGDGRYGFINHPAEARTGFANQLAGALRVAAADVKTQVEWNPDRVISWRQIGYDLHQLKKEQFRDNTVDAAEIGAAESGTALYAVQVNRAGKGPLGVARVRYKIPATGEYREEQWELPYQRGEGGDGPQTPAMRLAVAAASFAEWLAQNPHAGNVSASGLREVLQGVPEAFPDEVRVRQLAEMIQQASRLELR